MTDHKSLTAALAAFQAELPDVSKGSTNPAFKSKYADLADVVKAVLPVLAKHGMAWITAPDLTEHGPVLRYELRHVSGESITGQWPLPEGVKAQELGSWITYGRRYTLSAVTGIAPDEDDDGNAAKSAPRARPQQKPPVTPPAGWEDAIDTATTTEALTALYERAGAEGWRSDAVMAALTRRRGELTAGS
jgi:hypothetical protein